MLTQGRSIQFVWFTPGDPPNAHKIFDSLVGVEADAYQRIMPPQVPLPITVQQSTVGGAVHRIQSHAGRVDYVIEAVGESPELPLLADPAQHIKDVLSKVDSFSSLVGDIVRAAVVVTLAEHVSVEEAANRFEKLFSNHFKLSDTRDLMFQMTKRVESKLGTINQLLRWHTEGVSFLPLMNTGIPNAPLQMLPEKHYFNYMMDVNTLQTPASKFEPAQHVDVYSQLTDHIIKLMNAETIEGVT